ALMSMPRLSMQPMNSRPTAPVAPTIATILFFTVFGPLFFQFGNKKAPSGLERGLGVSLWLNSQSRAPRPAPSGLVVFVLVVVVRVVMGREPMGEPLFRQRLQLRHVAHFAAQTRLA